MSLILSGTNGLSDVDGSAATPAIRGTDANTGMFFPAADTIAFAEGGVEAMRLDSAGNLGVGTSSPISFATQTSVTVNGSVYGRYDIRSGGTHVANWYSDTTISGFGTITNIPLLFTTNNQERMRIDSSGNVGMSVTPAAWGTTNSSTLQIRNVSLAGLATNDLQLTSNGYFDGSSWRYIASSVAPTNYFQSTGTHVWRYAASGTAGATLTWSEAMRIDSSGNLLVGTTTVPGGSTAGVRIYGSSAAGAADFSRADGRSVTCNRYGSDGATLEFQKTGTVVGTVSVTASATAYNTSSDYRLKNTIEPMTGALAKVAQLKPVTYKWNVDGSDGEGFIAHELAEVVPDAVTGAKDAVDADGKPVYQGIDTSFLVATLTAAIQEQQVMIEQLKADVAALKGTV